MYEDVDVTNEEAVNIAVDRVDSLFGGVDILLCFAGITESKLAVEYPIDSWRKIFDVNVHGSFLVARAVARLLSHRQFTQKELISLAGTASHGPSLAL